jgi:hypothetical protein
MRACRLPRSFRLINQRAPLVFNYFLNATSANGFFTPATLAAQSGALPFDNYNAPQQVHLALTQTQGEALVQWTTRDAGAPTVLYGEVSGALFKVGAGGCHVPCLPQEAVLCSRWGWGCCHVLAFGERPMCG